MIAEDLGGAQTMPATGEIAGDRTRPESLGSRLDRVGIGRMARRTLDRALASWSVGRLTVHLPDGATLSAGAQGAEPHSTMWIDRYALFRKFALKGDLGAGESYVDGDWRTDDLATFLELALKNQSALPLESMLTKLLNLGNDGLHWLRRNTRSGSRRNIEQHYDLSNEFFTLFLDESMTYSCGIFDAPGQALVEAQENKFRRFCEKLAIGRGDHVLEIGCGWGGFAIYAASRYGCRVTGITVSPAQLARARERVAEAGLADRVDIQLCDYRDLQGRFDKIVSIEMFEAVGREYWDTFFTVCNGVLAPDGLIGLQTISVPDHRWKQYARHCDWIQKYIFPGGLLPSLGELCAAMMRGTTLSVHQLEDIGLHYATTLAYWRSAFLRRLPDVRSLGFDDRFIRMWEYYLAVCEAAFRARMIGNLQLVIARTGGG